MRLATMAWLFAATSLVALGGCFGSGETAEPTPDTSLSEAKTALNTLLAKDSTTLADAQALEAQFGAAYSRHTDDPEARVGYAIALTASAAEEMANVLESGIDDLRSPDRERTVQRAMRRAGERTRLRNLACSRLAPTDLGVDPVDFAALLTRQDGGTQLSQALTLMRQTQDKMHSALRLLAEVPADAPPMLMRDPRGDGNVEFGEPERNALRALLYAAIGMMDYLQAYELDSGDFDWHQRVIDHAEVPQAEKTYLAEEWLPPDPWGRLKPDGAMRLQRFRSYWGHASGYARRALGQFIERGNGPYVVNPDEFLPRELDTALASLNEFDRFLAGPVVIQDYPVQRIGHGGVVEDVIDLDLDLMAWVQSPPADIKALFPDLVLAHEIIGLGTPLERRFVRSQIHGEAWPSPTFAGLFPDPDDIALAQGRFITNNESLEIRQLWYNVMNHLTVNSLL